MDVRIRIDPQTINIDPQTLLKIFINHVLQLIDEFWCPDGISPVLVGLPVHRNIAKILTISYAIIKSLLDPIAEAPGQLVELGYLSSGPAGAKPYNNGVHFLFFLCLKRSNECESVSKS